MYSILNISKSGMNASQNKVNVISNNIVNANTSGYKRVEVEFQELVRETLNRDYIPKNNTNMSIGTGVRSINEIRNYSQGSLKNTEVMSNLAIDGEGFFRVIRQDNTYAYTRNGEFSVDATGKIVDGSGNVLDIEFYNNNSYGNLGITNENFSVNKQGEVFVDGNNVGKINVYTTTGDNDLLSVGGSLFVTKNEENLTITNNSNIMQGYVEMSNVNIAQEMTDLISVQRSFQLNGKGFSVADEMWSMINNLQSR